MHPSESSEPRLLAAPQPFHWTEWPGKNRWFADGRILLGSSLRPGMETFFLILVPSVFFLFFPGWEFTQPRLTAPPDTETPRLGIWPILVCLLGMVSSLGALLRSLIGNPGYLRRSRSLTPELLQRTGRPQQVQTVLHQGKVTVLKFCGQWKLPPRNSHLWWQARGLWLNRLDFQTMFIGIDIFFFLCL